MNQKNWIKHEKEMNKAGRKMAQKRQKIGNRNDKEKWHNKQRKRNIREPQ